MTSITDIEKRTLSTFSYGERLNPLRDWLLLLVIAAVLFLASIATNVLIYEGVKSGVAQSSLTSAVPEVDASAITNVEAVFTQRATEMQNYEKVYQFVDPSK
ncbi:MAG TPA: hypothetical protein VHB93_00090 [Candidatus Paceibacterota bacterium]|nr:hypothetical protein [Candidatus Paceibacterota bacterium]